MNQEGTTNVNATKGILWAILASAMWGVSGTVLQFISQNEALPAPWFLSIRTLTCGVILIVISAFMYGKAIFNVFKTKTSIMWLLSYGIFGLGANLLTFYLSVQNGNASASTILQYLSPIFIVLGGIVFQHKRPLPSDLLVFGIALLGVFLAITRGDVSKLSIPFDSLLWGIGSGITAALYVVLPRKLSIDNPPIVVLGWGSLVAGIIFNFNHPVWVSAPKMSVGIVLGLAAVILFGTILPFSLLIHASKFASSEVVSLVDATQPVVTFILSIIFFNLKMNFVEIVGAFLVILAIYLLQYFHHKIDSK